jgi:hypothetical protein
MKSLYYKLRGCSWGIFVQGCRLADHGGTGRGRRGNSLGFRIFQEYT